MSKFKQIKINLLPEDYEGIKRKAYDNDMTIAALVRLATNSAKLPEKKHVTGEYKELIFQINKIGVNINQMTKVLNNTRKADAEMLRYLNVVQEKLVQLIVMADKHDS